MGVLDKIKKWLTKKPSKELREANKISYYGGTASKSTQKEIKRSIEKAEDKKREKQKELTSAFKTTKPSVKKAEAKDKKTNKAGSSAFKATPPAVKHQSTALGTLSTKTENRYKRINKAEDIKRTRQKTHAEALKSRIDAKYGDGSIETKRRIKSGDYISDPDVAKYDYLKHPVVSSLARGGLSGATFGLSELAIDKLPQSKAMEEAEKTYQQNKVAPAEFVGEMAGSLAGFGLTSGASKAGLTKLAPNKVARLGEGATEWIAGRKIVQDAARKEALRKLGATATKEEIEHFAKAKAAKLVAALGEDAAINLTTGAVSDVSHAIIDSDNPLEFAKNMGLNIAGNVFLGGVTSAVPALRGSNVEDAFVRNRRAARAEINDIANANRAGDLIQNKRALPKVGESIDDRLARLDADRRARRGTVEIGKPEEGIDVINPNAKRGAKTVEFGRADEGIDVINPDRERPRTVEIGRPDENIEAINPNARRASETVDAVDNDVIATINDDSLSLPERHQAFEGRLFNLMDERDRLMRSASNGNANVQSRIDDINAEIKTLNDEMTSAEQRFIDSNEEKAIKTDKARETSTADSVEKNEQLNLEDEIGKAETKKTRTIDDIKAEMDEAHRIAGDVNASAAEREAATKRFSELNDELLEKQAKASAEEMPKPEYEEMKTSAQQRADEVMGAEYKQQKPQSKEIPENVQKTADKRSNAIREELAKEDIDPNLKADNPEENIRSALAEDKAKARAKAEKISKGQAAVRDAYEQQTGEKWKVGDNGVETDAGKRSTFGQLVEASKEYHQSQGRHTERKLSKYARTQVRVVSKERADYIIENIIKNSQDAEYGVLHHEEVYREVAKSLEEDWDTNINKLADIADGGDWGGKETPRLLATAQFLGELIDDVPRTPETDALAKIAYLAGQNLTTSSAQTMNFRRHFAHLSPASKLDVILSDLAKTLDSAQGFNKKHSKGLKGLNHWERLDYIKGQLLEDKKLVDSIEKMVYAKTPEELDLLRRRNEGLLSQIEGLEKQKAELTEKLKAAEAKATPPLSVDEMAQIKELDIEIEGLNTQKQILDSQIEKAEKANADPDELTKAQAKVIREFNRHNPKTGYDVVQELRYIAMLLNPKTHIRNIGGSGFFKPVRDVSNTIRSAIEEGVAKSVDMELDVKHGGFSPTAFFDSIFSNTEAGKKASEAINKPEIASALAGKSKMAESTTTMRGRSKHLIGKGIDAVSDFSTFLLTKEDELFKRQAFKENYIKSYNKYLKTDTPITPKIEAAIEAEALQEAKIATFNEYNELAKYLSKMNRTAYDANASGAVRWLARTGNALMPFAKAPANLTKQSINYSPLGIARGMYGIKQAAKKNDAKALNKAIDELSSGLTGTGIFALGALLGSTTDMFTTNVGKDDPAGKHKKNLGYQNYSINFVDPETGKGTSFTLDWLVPISAVFFSGVEMANQTKANGFNLLDLVHASGGWAQVTSRLAEPVLDTSMMSGLNSMIEGIRGNYNGDDKLGVAHIFFRETTQSYLNSLVPTMLGQASRTMYQSDKQILGDNDWKYWANSTRSKAGLANLDIESLGGALGADTNVYGEVKNDKGKSLKQALKDRDEKALKEYRLSALKNFLSPANIQRIDISEVDKAKLDEYEERVKNGENPEDLAYLFPKKAGEWQRNFYYGSEAAGTKTDVKMTNKEISIYNQAKKTGGAEGMRAALDTVIFNRWVGRGDDKHQVEGECYSQEEKDKLIKQFEGKSIREVEEWLYNNKLFKKATKAEQKQVIDDLWSLANASTSVGSKREGERAVIKARGGDLVDYDYKNEVPERVQKNIAGALASGIVDQEKALDFARNAVKKYYKTDPDGVKGGTVSSYYNKKEMMEYLANSGYSYEEMEALYNAFKDADAKPFSGVDISSGGGRGGYSGWHSWGRGGGGGSASMNKAAFKARKTDVANSVKGNVSAKSTTSGSGKVNAKIDITPLNIKAVTPSTSKAGKSGSANLASALEDLRKTEKKVAPPKARR